MSRSRTSSTCAYFSLSWWENRALTVSHPRTQAPVSLVSSLEEYLNDPNFASNREEYKENKRIADGGAPGPSFKCGGDAETCR